MPEGPSAPVPIVAIGASAGGLEALERLFRALACDLGQAYVVIQHLSPDHKSMMSELLARYTSMPVQTAEEGERVRPDRVYLIPPGMLMSLDGGVLRLVRKPAHTLSLPIDLFFASLAREQGADAVGVVLSGTGADGTEGGQMIQQAGGRVYVQEPGSARFDGMPRSAISRGLDRAVLQPEQIAEHISARISEQSAQARATPLTSAQPDDAGAAPGGSMEAGGLGASAGPEDPHKAGFQRILDMVSAAGGVDFQEYKPGTLSRRLERRMTQRGMGSEDDYLQLLRQDPAELKLLRRELLIPVTQFFRDPECFESLRRLVVEPLVAARGSHGSIRVWCPGAATGEEAYSVTVLFLEAFESLRQWPSLKVFATDVDPETIEVAARGRYPLAAQADLPADILARYFERGDDHLHVRPALRQRVVFARHNLLTDPPFTRMDLVVCRNTLIYFCTDPQRRVLRRLHYALAPQACLFMGKSESIGVLEGDFQALEARHKIWRQIRPALPTLGRAPPQAPSAGSSAPPPGRGPERTSPGPDRVDLIEVGRGVLRETYAPPPAVLLNTRQEVVHVYGDAGRYLAMRPGQAGLTLGRLLPDGLLPYALALLQKAARDRQPVRSEVIEAVLSDAPGRPVQRSLSLAALPVLRAEAVAGMLLVFEPVFAAGPDPASGRDIMGANDIDTETFERIDLLESELALTRESLQASIENLEASNEELQATNEELMASNEELQSTNEELQSVNEELNTINAEYHEKIGALDRVYADLDVLTRVAAASAIFVDDELRLTRYSPEAPAVFRIRDSDLGRPIADLSHDLNYPAFFDDLRRCVDRMAHRECDVTALGGRHFLVKMMPYQVPSSARRAAVVSFVESTQMHQASELQAILDALAEHVAVLERDGRICMVNAAWRRFAFENGGAQLQGNGPGVNYLAICAQSAARGAPDALQAAEGLQGVLEGRLESFSMDYPCHAPDRRRWFAMHVRPLRHGARGAVVSHVDITAWYESVVNPEDPARGST